MAATERKIPGTFAPVPGGYSQQIGANTALFIPDFFQKPMTVVQMKSIFYWKDHWIGNFPDLFTDYRVLFVPSPSGITSDLSRIICSHKRFSFKKLSLLSLCNKFLYLLVHFINYLLNSGIFHFL